MKWFKWLKRSEINVNINGDVVRIFFAGCALIGLIATPKAPPDCDPVTYERLGIDAVKCADAVIAALKDGS